MRVNCNSLESISIIVLLIVANSLLTIDGNVEEKCNDGQDSEIITISKAETSHCSTSSQTSQTDDHDDDMIKNDPLWDQIREHIKAEDQVPVCTDEDWKSDPKNVCKCYTDLITKDLKLFSDGVTLQMIEEAKKRGVLYQIRNGHLYRESDCKFPARCSGIEHFLSKIISDVKDMEFVINVSDWPQISRWLPQPIPVFSFSKTADYVDITYPAWTFWAGGPAISLYPKGLGRWDLMRKSLTSTSEKIKWIDKKSIAFFRGSRTSSERDPLVLLSRKHPTLVDAQYTKNQAWKSEKDTLNAKPAKEVSLEEHCHYKYLFNYRGVAASFRYKHLFLCQSLVFHVGHEWIEFFYPQLRPWIHYVPVDKNADENSLKSLIEFFKANDALASKIADRGYQFIQNNLRLSHVICYWKELLKRYGDLIKFEINPKRKNLIKIM